MSNIQKFLKTDMESLSDILLSIWALKKFKL